MALLTFALVHLGLFAHAGRVLAPPGVSCPAALDPELAKLFDARALAEARDLAVDPAEVVEAVRHGPFGVVRNPDQPARFTNEWVTFVNLAGAPPDLRVDVRVRPDGPQIWRVSKFRQARDEDVLARVVREARRPGPEFTMSNKARDHALTGGYAMDDVAHALKYPIAPPFPRSGTSSTVWHTGETWDQRLVSINLYSGPDGPHLFEVTPAHPRGLEVYRALSVALREPSPERRIHVRFGDLAGATVEFEPGAEAYFRISQMLTLEQVERALNLVKALVALRPGPDPRRFWCAVVLEDGLRLRLSLRKWTTPDHYTLVQAQKTDRTTVANYNDIIAAHR